MGRKTGMQEREKGQSLEGKGIQAGAIGIPSKELGLAAAGDPGPRPSLRTRLQFLGRMKQAEEGFWV